MHNNSAAMVMADAPNSALRSPIRAVISAAGILATSEPRPISAMIKPARAGVAPRSRALNAITGKIAPLAKPKSSEGPYAGMAMLFKLKLRSAMRVSFVGHNDIRHFTRRNDYRCNNTHLWPHGALAEHTPDQNEIFRHPFLTGLPCATGRQQPLGSSIALPLPKRRSTLTPPALHGST